VSSAEQVWPIARELLRRFSPPRPVRLIGVRVAGLDAVRTTCDDQLTLVV
jgi:hypothetical protein